MPVSPLVITLEPSSQRDAYPPLLLDQRLLRGEIRARRLPAVLETATLEEAERFVDDLSVAPGVTCVDVVSVDFSDVIAGGLA